MMPKQKQISSFRLLRGLRVQHTTKTLKQEIKIQTAMPGIDQVYSTFRPKKKRITKIKNRMKLII
jgi:hypothetical protein